MTISALTAEGACALAANYLERGGNMFPKTGNKFPRRIGRLCEADYTAAISEALKTELGASASAAKQIQRWTGAADRTARNWLNGAVGPRGHHLMELAGESDAVLSAVIMMMDRPELALAPDLHAVELALTKASGAFEVLRRHRADRGRTPRP